MSGFVNLSKPKGMSSQTAVTVVKKFFNEKKAGHLGTLDPLAEGVLPVALGKATRLFDYFLQKNKRYYAEFTFGVETDTLDSEGVTIKTSDVIPSQEAVFKAAQAFVGEISQLPPNYSALSINGVKAYKLARKGEQTNLKERKVTVFKFDLVKQINENTYAFEIDCKAGTYIRSLARDLGVSCGSCAYMSRLIRTQSGCFSLDNAVSIENLKLSDLKSVDSVLCDLPRVDVDAKFFEKLCNGNRLPSQHDFSLSRIYCKNEFFGLATAERGTMKIDFMLKE